MTDSLTISYSGDATAVDDLDHPAWHCPPAAVITRYWSGETAPGSRHCSVRLLWNEAALFARFDARQEEPLVIDPAPALDVKTPGLWDRDVCEIFISPGPEIPKKYFEFEAAPTAEWVDLAIEISGPQRNADLEYDSGMQAAARIEERAVTIAMKIEWAALEAVPSPGDIWRGNLFRCVGSGPLRGYLAWQPTLTETPNFHVPEKFGRFVFSKNK